MGTLIDIVKKLNERINSNELSATVSASEPWTVEIDDKGIEAIETQLKGLTTLEEAKNNAEVFNHMKEKVEKTLGTELFNKHKSDFSHGVEKELLPIAKIMGIESDGKKWSDTFKLIKNKADSLSGDVNDTILAQNTEIEKLQNSLATQKEGRKKDKEAHGIEMNNFKVDDLLTREIEAAVKLADAYQIKEVKTGLLNQFKDTIRNKANVSLTDGVLKFSNKDNPDLEVFNENGQKATLPDLIGEESRPYIKAKAPADGPKPPATPEVANNIPTFAPGSAMAGMRSQQEANLASQDVG